MPLILSSKSVKNVAGGLKLIPVGGCRTDRSVGDRARRSGRRSSAAALRAPHERTRTLDEWSGYAVPRAALSAARVVSLVAPPVLGSVRAAAAALVGGRELRHVVRLRRCIFALRFAVCCHGRGRCRHDTCLDLCNLAGARLLPPVGCRLPSSCGRLVLQRGGRPDDH